jgi:chromosome segregation ATPase
VEPESASVEPEGERFSLAGALHGLRTAVFGVRTSPDDELLRVRRAVIEVSERLERIEDRFQGYRVEMQNLTTRVEDALEQATQRYARARAAESRRNKAEAEEDGPADPLADPEAYRAALARGGIAGGV